MHYQHFAEMKNLSRTILAKHLREVLGQSQYTKAYVEEKQLDKASMLETCVGLYREQGLALEGAPGWPWPVNRGRSEPTASTPQAENGKPLTAKDQSARLAPQRLRALELDMKKDDSLPTDPLTGKTLIDPMHITGPGYVHPRFWDYPALPAGQQYRVAVVFDLQGQESTQQTHLQLNGQRYIAQRDMVVYLPAEILEVARTAKGKIAIPGKENAEMSLTDGGYQNLKMRAFQTEHLHEIGEVVTDAKGVFIRGVGKRFDGMEWPTPQKYAPEEHQQQQGA